jgi:hypothetical protein
LQQQDAGTAADEGANRVPITILVSFKLRPSLKLRPVAGGEMESVTSPLWGAWEWIKGLEPTSAAAERHRDCVRRQLMDERAKPAVERDEKRLQALLREDTRLHGAYYSVSGACAVGPPPA